MGEYCEDWRAADAFTIAQVVSILGLQSATTTKRARRKTPATGPGAGCEPLVERCDLIEFMKVWGFPVARLSRQRRKILIADRNLESESIARALAEKAGFHVTTVGSFAEVQTVLRAGCTALVVLNRRLTDAMGVDVLRWIRSEPALRSMPVVMMSAMFGWLDEFNATLRDVADACLEKPFTFEQLMACVERLIGP